MSALRFRVLLYSLLLMSTHMLDTPTVAKTGQVQLPEGQKTCKPWKSPIRRRCKPPVNPVLISKSGNVQCSVGYTLLAPSLYVDKGRYSASSVPASMLAELETEAACEALVVTSWPWLYQSLKERVHGDCQHYYDGPE